MAVKRWRVTRWNRKAMSQALTVTAATQLDAFDRTAKLLNEGWLDPDDLAPADKWRIEEVQS